MLYSFSHFQTPLSAFFSPPYHALPFSLKVSHSLTTLVLPLVQPNLVFSPHLFVSLTHFAPSLVLKPLTHIQLALILALKFGPPDQPRPTPLFEACINQAIPLF